MVAKQDPQTNEFSIFQVEALPSQDNEDNTKYKLSKVQLGKEVDIVKLLAKSPKKSHDSKDDHAVENLKKLNNPTTAKTAYK
jgi:hypothetical protein